MAMIKEGDEIGQILAPGKDRYRSDEEIKIREAVEPWLRSIVPDCRIVHELNVGQGQARADIVAIGKDTFHAVEIKSSYDSTSRLMVQSAFFSLCSPRLWLVVAADHLEDVEMITYLLPHVGVVVARKFVVNLTDSTETEKTGYCKPGTYSIRLETLREAQERLPHRRAMLMLLWRDELLYVAQRLALVMGNSKITHPNLVKLLAGDKVSDAHRMQGVCDMLRGRSMAWKSDEPVKVPR